MPPDDVVPTPPDALEWGRDDWGALVEFDSIRPDLYWLMKRSPGRRNYEKYRDTKAAAGYADALDRLLEGGEVTLRAVKELVAAAKDDGEVFDVFMTATFTLRRPLPAWFREWFDPYVAADPDLRLLLDGS